MERVLPEIILVVDLLGFALALWLALHGLGEGRAGLRTRWLIALPAAGVLLFALAVWDDSSPIAGMSVAANWLRLALVPLPLVCLALAQTLRPSVQRTRSRFPVLGLSLLLVALPLAAALLLGGPLGHARLAQSWLFLPLYALPAGAAFILAAGLLRGWQRGGATGSEQGAAAALRWMTLLALVGTGVLAVEMVFGLGNPRVPGPVRALALPLRLVGSLCLVLVLPGFSRAVIRLGQADGLNPGPALRHSLNRTLPMLLLFVAVGTAVVWYWVLPYALLLLFIALALVGGWLWSVLGQRQARAAPVAVALPPALRPLLRRLARQLNSPQLALALRNEKGNDYRIVAALHPTWEGEVLDVSDPNQWAERGLGGWNMPVKSTTGQHLGVLTSEPTGPLAPTQEMLLRAAVAEIAQLLDSWQALHKASEALDSAREAHQQQAATLEARRVVLAASGPATPLTQEAEAALSRFQDPSAMGVLPLARRKLVAGVLPPAKESAAGRGEVLQRTLESLIEQLRPLEGEPPILPTPEWWPYLVLVHFFLLGEKETEVQGRLNLTPQQFEQGRRAGLLRVGWLLAEIEAGAAGLEGQKVERPALPSGPIVGRPVAAPPAARPATAPPLPSTPPAPQPKSTGGLSSLTGRFGRGGDKAAPATPDKGATPKAVGTFSSLTGRFRRDETKSAPTGAATYIPDTQPEKTGGLAAFAGRFGRDDKKSAAPPVGEPHSTTSEPKPSGGLSGFAGRFGRDDKKSVASPAEGSGTTVGAPKPGGGLAGFAGRIRPTPPPALPATDGGRSGEKAPAPTEPAEPGKLAARFGGVAARFGKGAGESPEKVAPAKPMMGAKPNNEAATVLTRSAPRAVPKPSGKEASPPSGDADFDDAQFDADYSDY